MVTSTSTTNLQPTLTSLGIGSGLQSSNIIDALISADSVPLNNLVSAAAGINTQLSSVGQLQSLTATMRDKANALTSPSLWGNTVASSSDSSSVSATTSTGAVAGNYSVTVSALASGQTVTSTAAAGTGLNPGTLTIQLGTYTGGTPPNVPPTGFTPKSGSNAVTITIGPGDTSLSAIRDKINAAGAGVTASIINDSSGARLSLTSTSTGLSNAFQISASETADDGNAATGLSALAFDATNSASPMTQNQTASNAVATINGIALNSESNTLSNVSDGLTLTLGKVTSSPVNIGLTADTGSVQTAVQSFVTAFNALASYIKTQTAYDPVAKQGAPLQGDSTVIGFQSQLRNVINQGTTASSTFSHLSDMGISMGADGTLSIDSTQLSAALTNLPEMQKAMATDTGTATSSGFMANFGNLGDAVLGVDGSLETHQTALQADITRNTAEQAQAQSRLDAERARLTAQYSALDTQMASLNSLSSYVSSQFGSSSSSSSG
jgi:flagellar hook-associated protein 2